MASKNRVIQAVGAVALALAMVASSFGLAAISDDEAYAYESKTQIVASGHGYLDPDYLTVHSTANPGASAKNHISYWSSNPAYAVHFVMDLDGSVVYQAMSTSAKAWHVGNGNSRTYGIELCEATNASDFEKQWTEAVKWCGDQLKSRGWSVARLLSHDQCRAIWGGTDHTDPNGYFQRFGHSWSEFKSDVEAYIGSGAVPEIDAEEGGDAAPGSVTGHNGTGFGGTYTCQASKLYIRTGPGQGYAAVGSYTRGGKVVLDDWYTVSGGYVWGRYTAYSGNVRYIAVGPWTGKPEANDYLVKGSVGGSSAHRAGLYYVDVDSSLNVRTGPGQGYRVTGSLHDGYPLYVSGWSGDWARYTTYSGATRYVCGDYLDAA